MAQTEHRLERRAQLLATRLAERVDAVRDAIAPPGQRPPFTTVLSRTDALAWWTQHRHDDLGRQVLARWSPDQIAQLDADLARHALAAQETGLPLAVPTMNGGEPSVA